MTKTKKVKNKSGRDLSIFGIGMVKAGESVTVDDGFHNANFEEVKKEKKLKNKSDEPIEDTTIKAEFNS